MAKRKTAEMKTEARRVKVADLYLQGKTQHIIAENVETAQSTVSRDLELIRSEWRSSRIRDFEDAQTIELEKIDTVERNAWRAWAGSQEDAVQHKEGETATGSVDTTTTASQYGDAKFLTIVIQCIDRRCKLLGLDATANAPQQHNGTHTSVPLTLEERKHHIEAIVQAHFPNEP